MRSFAKGSLLYVFILVVCVLPISVHEAKADTFSNEVTYTVDDGPNGIIGFLDFSLTYTVNLDKSVYLPGETISVTQYSQPYVPPGDPSTVLGGASLAANVDTSAWQYFYKYGEVFNWWVYFSDYFYKNHPLLQFTAPSVPGTYEVNFLSTIDFEKNGLLDGYAITYPANVTDLGYYNRYSVSYSIPFTVANTPPPNPPYINTACNSTGTSATISWPAVSGATAYYPRVWTTTGSCPSGWTMLSDGNTCYIDGMTGTSVPFATTPGVAYTTWVHAGDPPNWDNPPSSTFTCEAPSLPPPVTSISHSCNADGTSTTLSWPASSGATYYQLGLWVNDTFCPSGWSKSPSDSAWDGHSCFIANVSGTSLSVPITPGTYYAAWVYPANAVGVNWDTPPTTGDFSCLAPASLCSDGSTPVNGVCPRGGGGSCTDPYDCDAPPLPGPGCNITVSPKIAAAGTQVTIGWASTCDSASAGCTTSVLGIPIPKFAGNGKITDTAGAVLFDDLSSSSGQNPLTATLQTLPSIYTFSGQMYTGYWPLLIPVSGSEYSCTTRVDPQLLSCPVGETLVNGNCVSAQCTKAGYPRCSTDGSSIEYLDDECTPQRTKCYYASYGYGCVEHGSEVACLTPKAPTVDFTVQPTLLRSGSSVQVTLQAQDVEQCSIESSANLTDGRLLNGSLGNDWSVSADYQSKPITGQTFFTLHCDGILEGTSVDQVVTVNLVPKVIEL